MRLRRSVQVWGGAIVALVACGPTPAPPSAVTGSASDAASAARALIAEARYAAFITVDSAGHPQARTVDPAPPDSAFVIRFATNPRTRKVAELRRNPRATLYWFAPQALGYVTLRGTARLIADTAEMRRWWRPEWTQFYSGGLADALVVEVRPGRLEIVSPAHGVTGDSLTWHPPTVSFGAPPP